MAVPTTTRKTIAIIGGGVSGALTAYHLIQKRVEARVVIIDPRPELGLGLAYSTPSLRHLLNVPAGKISALPSEPDHFLKWMQANYDAEATPATFAPRTVFGRYIRSLLAEAVGLEQIQAAVVDYRATGTRVALTLDEGRGLECNYTVLATGNFDPAMLPGVSDEARPTNAYFQNAWAAATYDKLTPDAPITLIGTGLTSVDVLLRLRELGHRGTITAVSRHGIFPNRHTAYAPLAESVIPSGTPATCIAYLRALRAAIRNGAEWRAAIDSLRADTNDLWLALPHAEQRRFRRHLQRRWDVVRHRMAPPIADIIECELADGTLIVREGHLLRVETAENGAAVVIRTASGQETFETSRVINCTGPSMNYRRVKSLLLESLFEQGLVTPGPLGGGFNSTRSGALIDTFGKTSKTLFNLGPSRLGTLLESIAIPEIRQQAMELATILVGRINDKHKRQPVDPSRSVPETSTAASMATA
jgi:hydroxyacylglutathione hydrolase